MNAPNQAEQPLYRYDGSTALCPYNSGANAGKGCIGEAPGQNPNVDQSNWLPEDPGVAGVDFYGIWGPAPRREYAVGEFGTIVHYDGTAWHPVSGVPTNQTLSAIWGSSAADIFVAGDGGTIAHYDGSAWTIQATPTSENLTGLWGSSSSDVFAVGLNGTILHYDGLSWVRQASPSMASLYGIWGGGGKVYAVGDAGTILSAPHVVGLAPGSVAFENQISGTTSPVHSLTVTNNGTADLSVTGTTLTPGAFTESDGCSGTTVHPSAFCVIGLTFRPTATGQQAATLNITTSGGNAGVSVTGNGVSASAATTFYFAEGYTGSGFTESLSLLMPGQGGGAIIDYYTASGVHTAANVAVDTGRVAQVSVNQAVGPDQQVSAKVTLPGPGVAERTIHFNIPGMWHGSSGIVGTTAPSTEWDFAEGSTLTNGSGGPQIFSEYLTLQNPNGGAVPVTLSYFTDSGQAPVKGLTLAANSRTTVEVFHGDTSNVSSCIANGAGANCGVGPGIGGVSVQVKSGSLPIIAERPFYVDGFSFGDGVIRDGHDAFGATAAGPTWNFAEGTTQGGFKEYLTLQNPGSAAATVNLNYFTDSGAHPVKTLTVNPHSRVTVEVFHGDATTNQNTCTPSGTGASCGVGPGIGGVSVQASSDQPIVAERPMYMVLDFGTGSVAGAHVVVGATGLGTLFGFAAASTVAGENDYLTIQNPGATDARVVVTYYPDGSPIVRSFTVSARTRHTVEVFKAAEGAGPGFGHLGIVVSSDQPILVEKPTYNSTSGAYGATDTLGYSPSAF
jgi:hypothetical protein